MSNHRHFCKAKAETQAFRAIALVQQKGLIQSVGTNRNYRLSLQTFCQYIKDNKLGDLPGATKEIAEAFLKERANDVSQKTLDMNRQAIQSYFQAKGDLQPNEKLPIIKSNIETKLEHRAYTPEQVSLIAGAQTSRNQFSTELAYACGLRAHELFTIRRIEEQPPSVRHHEDGQLKATAYKWSERTGVAYTVVGKGGLIREIRIPEHLAARLEERRLNQEVLIKDRNVNYRCVYDLAGGHSWSRSFSAASSRVLGWSTGAHGLRHSYAQERMEELSKHCSYTQALETVSQEMGHFREEITTVYLR